MLYYVLHHVLLLQFSVIATAEAYCKILQQQQQSIARKNCLLRVSIPDDYRGRGERILPTIF